MHTRSCAWNVPVSTVMFSETELYRHLRDMASQMKYFSAKTTTKLCVLPILLEAGPVGLLAQPQPCRRLIFQNLSWAVEATRPLPASDKLFIMSLSASIKLSLLLWQQHYSSGLLPQYKAACSHSVFCFVFSEVYWSLHFVPKKKERQKEGRRVGGRQPRKPGSLQIRWRYRCGSSPAGKLVLTEYALLLRSSPFFTGTIWRIKCM